MLNTTELEARIEELRELARENRAEYRLRVAELEGQWSNWLIAEYASDLPEGAHSLIFGRAWDEGHSSGYSEVANYFQEFADFARQVRALCPHSA